MVRTNRNEETEKLLQFKNFFLPEDAISIGWWKWVMKNGKVISFPSQIIRFLRTETHLLF